MKWSLSLLIAAAAATGVAFALAAPDEPDAAATFAWHGRGRRAAYGRCLRAGCTEAGDSARDARRPGSTVEAVGERQLVVDGRREDGSAILASVWARGDRLTAVGSFTPVAELGAAPVRPKGLHPFAGWDAKREVVTDRAIIRFEAGGRPRPDRVGWEGVGLRALEIGGVGFLLGTAGPRYAPLELTLPDGRRLEISTSEGIVFFRLPDGVGRGDAVTVVPAGMGDNPHAHADLVVEGGG